MNVNGSGQADALLRQTRAHHVQLSAMADVKASMLITVASIVLSLNVSHVMRPGLQGPSLVLMSFCVLTILLAVFSAVPKMRFRKKPPTALERANPHFNLLLFVDYAGMSYDEFEAEMAPLLNDPAQGYEAQVREIYALGAYLTAGKYRYLRLAYLSFMAGLVASLGLVLIGLTI